MSNSLDKSRKEINEIDRQMAELFVQRMRVVEAVAEYKKEHDIAIIDKARETLDESRRAAYYKEALDLVMELAVELPTYQRSDLFAYNTNIIDVNSLTPASELTPYNGPMSRIWEVSLNETK